MPVVTAQEAGQMIAQEQRKLNAGRVLHPMLARLQKLQVDEVFSICNVGPWAHHLERASLMVDIPAYDPTADHKKLGYAASIPMPDVRFEAKILDEHEFTHYTDDGRMVALDLIGVGFGLPGHNALLKFGVFVPAGKLPTPEEIKQANQRLEEHVDVLISEARDAFDKGREEWTRVRSDRHLWAARKRGIREAWTSDQHTEQSTKCEMCGKFNPAAIAKCQCGNIIDFELYKRLEKRQKQQLEELELEEQTKPGRK